MSSFLTRCGQLRVRLLHPAQSHAGVALGVDRDSILPFNASGCQTLLLITVLLLFTAPLIAEPVAQNITTDTQKNMSTFTQ